MQGTHVRMSAMKPNMAAVSCDTDMEKQWPAYTTDGKDDDIITNVGAKQATCSLA